MDRYPTSVLILCTEIMNPDMMSMPNIIKESMKF